jgi:hypothetical protein
VGVGGLESWRAGELVKYQDTIVCKSSFFGLGDLRELGVFVSFIPLATGLHIIKTRTQEPWDLVPDVKVLLVTTRRSSSLMP